jgi:predicted enzyme related to lactoylglutathione lyase
MIQGLRTVVYPVTDIVAGKQWYQQVLGVAPHFDEAFYVGFAVGGFELGLIPDGVPGASGCIAYWGVDDAEHEAQRLVGLKADLLEEVKDVGGGIKVATIQDPFGNLFGLIENPHFDPRAVA